MTLWQNSKFPLPSPSTIRRRLDGLLDSAQQIALHGLVPGSKCALALDNWSSPGTRLCFMAIVATFIDKQWEYREALIGFEPLDGAHTGKELATIVRRVISQYKLDGRVHAITTDNASNNNTMMTQISEMIKDLCTDEDNLYGKQIYHIPCFAHIIQLAQKALLGSIRINPTNAELQMNWDERATTDELKGLGSNKGLL